MNRKEATVLIHMIKTLCPQQRFEDDVQGMPGTSDLWAEVLRGIDGPEGAEAVKRLVTRQKFVHPSDIITEVKSMRRDRLERAGAEGATSDMPGDADKFMEELHRRQRAIARGNPVPELRALEPGGRFSDGPASIPPPEASAELALLRNRLKPAEKTEPAPKSPPTSRHDADTMRRYEEAKKLLAALPDFGVDAQAQAGDELGADASTVHVAIRAAEIVKTRRQAVAS